MAAHAHRELDDHLLPVGDPSACGDYVECLLAYIDGSDPRIRTLTSHVLNRHGLTREQVADMVNQLEDLLITMRMLVLHAPEDPVDTAERARNLKVEEWIDSRPEERALEHLASLVDPGSLPQAFPVPRPDSADSHSCVTCLVLEDAGIAQFGLPVEGTSEAGPGGSTDRHGYPLNQGPPPGPPPGVHPPLAPPLSLDNRFARARTQAYHMCDRCRKGRLDPQDGAWVSPNMANSYRNLREQLADRGIESGAWLCRVCFTDHAWELTGCQGQRADMEDVVAAAKGGLRQARPKPLIPLPAHSRVAPGLRKAREAGRTPILEDVLLTPNPYEDPLSLDLVTPTTKPTTGVARPRTPPSTATRANGAQRSSCPAKTPKAPSSSTPVPGVPTPSGVCRASLTGSRRTRSGNGTGSGRAGSACACYTTCPSRTL